MSILVTGGNGAIGSWVLRYLVERKIKPISYDVLDIDLVKDLSGEVTFVRGDVTDPFNLMRTIRQHRVDRIVHAAALVGQCQSNPFAALKVNCEGTLNVLEAARLLDSRRVVYFSTKSVYGIPTGVFGPPEYKKITEDHPKNPIKLYESTKLLGENLALNYAEDYGMDIITLKFPSLYGLGRASRHGFFAILDRMIGSALAGKPFKVGGGAQAKEEWCYTKDCARGAVLACLADRHRFKQYHIGTGESHNMLEVVQKVRNIIRGAQIEIGEDPDYYGTGFMYNYILDISRAKEDLGYEPMYPLEQGIQDYVLLLRRLGAG